MNMTKIALGVAAVISATSANALTFGTNGAPQTTLYISGASAQDDGIRNVVDTLCTDALTTYDGGTNYKGYYCTINGSRTLVVKRSEGGSGCGVAPVAQGAVPVTDADCSGENSPAIKFVRFNASNCNDGTLTCNGAVTDNIVPDAGVSDVDPGVFGVPLSNYQGVVSGSGVIFGTPISISFRNALQEIQFPGVDFNVADREDPQYMPNLSTKLIVALFSGAVNNWNQIKAFDPATNSYVGLADHSAIQAADRPYDDDIAGANPMVHICRRVPSSGTQRQFQAKFLRFGCLDGAPAPLSTLLSNDNDGPIAYEGSGSGNVSQCLVGADSAGPIIDTTDPDWAGFPKYVDGVGGKQWAIGIQSLEKGELKNGAFQAKEDFRFVKIDGVKPSVENVKNGTYNDWVENSFQWNNLSGSKLALIQAIATQASSAADAAALSANFVHHFNEPGELVGPYLALASNGNTVTPDNYVTPFSHALSGQTDNCSVPNVWVTGAGPETLVVPQ